MPVYTLTILGSITIGPPFRDIFTIVVDISRKVGAKTTSMGKDSIDNWNDRPRK